ncbi:MAG: allophanate hydrolase, partial [Frankiales bacterium]|nr:allophanate hydrolase [Frankiales bacterium]
GAHMSGLPLNDQLVSRGGRLVCRARTAPSYRMLRVPTGVPRPALVAGSSSYEVEVWELPAQGLGELVGLVGAPLRLGQVTLSDGTSTVGFVGDEAMLRGAEEVAGTSWRDRP